MRSPWRRRTDQVRIIIAEALVVEPDEVLVLRLSDDLLGDPQMEQIFADLEETLTALGLKERYLIVQGIELAKVKRDA